MTLRFSKKSDLIEALEARRPLLQKRDDAALKAHKAEEKKALATYREQLKAAAKLCYEELRGEVGGTRWGGDPWYRSHKLASISMDFPGCPVSLVDKLDKELRVLAATRQERFNIAESGERSGVFGLLVDAIEGDMCKDPS